MLAEERDIKFDLVPRITYRPTLEPIPVTLLNTFNLYLLNFELPHFLVESLTRVAVIASDFE